MTPITEQLAAVLAVEQTPAIVASGLTLQAVADLVNAIRAGDGPAVNAGSARLVSCAMGLDYRETVDPLVDPKGVPIEQLRVLRGEVPAAPASPASIAVDPDPAP